MADETYEAFATPVELSAYSKGAIGVADPRSQGALDGASTAIRRYCGWHIAPEVTSTVKLDGPGGRILSLPSLNVTAVTSIIDHAVALTDETDYQWSADGSVRRVHACWTDDYRSIDATFIHGYGFADDVKQILLASVSRALSSPSGAVSNSTGPFAVKWSTVAPGVSGGLALLEHELSVLDTYRIVTV